MFGSTLLQLNPICAVSLVMLVTIRKDGTETERLHILKTHQRETWGTKQKWVRLEEHLRPDWKSHQVTKVKALCPVCPQADLCVTPAGSLNVQIPSLLSMPTRNHMDITIPPLPAVAPEVLRVAEHRHKKGLMYPYIYHALTKVRLILIMFGLEILVAFIFICVCTKLKKKYTFRKHKYSHV